MKVGDLVQLGPHYKHRERWAIITSVEEWGSHCKITFMDTKETVEAIKSGLITFSNEEQPQPR